MYSTDVGPSDQTPPGNERLSLDEAFEAIADERRRAVLAQLLDTTNGVEIEELIGELAGPDADERQIEVSLYHVHLPKLDAVGVIDWDDDRGLVEPTPSFAVIESLLRSV